MQDSATMRVLLVSADDGIAGPIERALRDDGLRLAGRSAVEEIERGPVEPQPDAVIVDGPLRSRTGSDLRRVHAVLPETPIIACAPTADGRAVRWAIDCGAAGVVWHERIAEALGPTLRSVCAGQLVFPRDARRQYQPPELTTREKQVLSLVVMGLSNGEIAQKLYLTESTVKSHLGTAFRKLGVRSRAEAARLVADPEHGFGTGILAITASPRQRSQA
jgi:two-component system response regulator DesR